MMDQETQKREVKRIFNRIPRVYDFLNRLLSLRQDVHWRRFTARAVRPGAKDRVLDLACGTGDLALEVAAQPNRPFVVGLDLVPAMLAPAVPKIKRKTGRVHLMAGDALELPFKNQSFDAVTIGFGIRNIPDRGAALREMHRVLAPQGRIYVLEFGTPRSPLVREFYNRYLSKALPKIGGLFSGDTSSYQYLADTIMNFPGPAEFFEEMRRAGFSRGRSYALTNGIAWLHVAEKI